MRPRISVVTCVSDSRVYEKNVASSLSAADVELLPVDNRGNRFSAAQALNRGWEKAGGEMVVFCHQDIVFPSGWVERLVGQVEAVERRCRGNWGVAGTFGRRGEEWLGHVQDRHGHRCLGALPTEVETLDEHCLVVRRDLGLRFDPGLPGYHLYGVDLCLECMIRGHPNYALDCCVTHLGYGAKGEDYRRIRRVLERKWRARRWKLRGGRRIPAKVYGPNGRLRFGLRSSSL